jgi:hypothetical protein
MDQSVKEALNALEKRGYLPQLRQMALNMSAPFFWSSQSPGHEPQILHNGTICYVHTGERGLGISADHVYRAYVKDRDERPDVGAQFGGNTIYPERFD